jgi:hypothetical protein
MTNISKIEQEEKSLNSNPLKKKPSMIHMIKRPDIPFFNEADTKQSARQVDNNVVINKLDMNRVDNLKPQDMFNIQPSPHFAFKAASPSRDKINQS